MSLLAKLKTRFSHRSIPVHCVHLTIFRFHKERTMFH